MTSEARARLRAQEDAETAPEAREPGRDDAAAASDGASGAPVAENAAGAAEGAGAESGASERDEGRNPDGTDDEPAGRSGRAWRRRPPEDDDASPARRRSGPQRGVVVALAVLWVLLLAACAFLWFRPPGRSSVSTGDYSQALEAARSEVVDLTSFDYVTLDADIARIKRVSTGDLQKESVSQLDKQRQQLSQAQAVVSTEVIGAGVTKADSGSATVLLVIQSTQKSAASPQAQVVRYRIEAQLSKIGGKWLLSGITGR